MTAVATTATRRTFIVVLLALADPATGIDDMDGHVLDLGPPRTARCRCRYWQSAVIRGCRNEEEQQCRSTSSPTTSRPTTSLTATRTRWPRGSRTWATS